MNNVYGIGLPRTGTTSLAKALRALGFKGENYCVLNDSNYTDDLVRFQNRRTFFKIDNSYYKSFKELLEDNEDAQFILTIRDSNSWRKSVRKVLNGQKYHMPNVRNYTQEVLQHFNKQGVLNQLLVVDLFDQSCDCSCKWKNLCEFLKIIPGKEMGSFPHVISWWA